MANVERYLEQADFYRAVAENTADAGTRGYLACMVRSYEVLAGSEARLEQLAKVEESLRQLYRPLAPRKGEE